MKKRLAAVFAATAVLGVTTAFAANPFSDVTPQDWAYQSVAQLAAAGVINGYPDGTFKGQNNITRFEMAQMVAKAMANEARANAEQQAMINRLADEFSSELNNLGVRVSNLENKVGNVKVTGDARLRYNQYDSSDNGTDDKSYFTYRARVNFGATINDKVSANVRVSTAGSSSTMTRFGDSTSSEVIFDRANVVYTPNKATSLTVGRYGEFIGGGLIYDDTFDGAKLTIKGDAGTLSASYGSLNYYGAKLQDVKSFGKFLDKDHAKAANADTNPTMTIVQGQANLGKNANVGGFYVWGNSDIDNDIYGFNANAKFDKVWVGGEWVKATKIDDGKAWVAGIGYGTYNQAKQGTWGLKAQYFDEDVNAPVYSSTWTQPKGQDYKAWAVTAQYALFNNVGLSAFYFFNGETQKGVDVPDYYRAQVDLKF